MALWNIVNRLFVRLIFSGSRFNLPIISDIGPTSLFYCFIIIVTKASCTSLDHFYFVYECLQVSILERFQCLHLFFLNVDNLVISVFLGLLLVRGANVSLHLSGCSTTAKQPRDPLSSYSV